MSSDFKGHMAYLPVFARVRGRTCLVVGGGTVALRKVQLLLGAGAGLRVVAPELDPALRALAGERLALRERPYRKDDLDDVVLVVAATNSNPVNSQVAADAEARGLLANVVDDRELSSFIVPSIVDRSPLVAAISSSGSSPVLARVLRAELERMLSPAHGELARFAERHRGRVKQRFPDVAMRRGFWESVLLGPIAELVLAGQQAAAERALDQALAAGQAASGEVCFVDCQSPEPDLLTLRAARSLGRADLVLYRRELAPLLSVSRRDATHAELADPPDEEALFARIADAARGGSRVCVLRRGHTGDLELSRLKAAGLFARAL